MLAVAGSFAPDGTTARGNTGAGIRVVRGETTGFDNCVAGSICISGTCQDICGFDGSAGATCATGYACTRYDQLFANNDDDPVAGACKAVFSSMMDGKFVKMELTTETPMGPMTGMGIYGYDNVSKKFQSTWIDSMGTQNRYVLDVWAGS